MIRTSLLFIVVTLFSVKTFVAQNLATSFYDISYFPEEMKPVQEFIDELCSDILVYGYSGNFITLKEKDFIEIKFPLKQEFSITIKDFNTDNLVKEHQLNYHFNFPYAKMNYEVEINESTFSLPHLVETAIQYYQLSEYDILPEVVKMRTDFRTLEEYFNAQIEFFKQTAYDLRINPDIFDGFEELPEKENYTTSEFDKLLVDTLLNHIDSQTRDNLLADFFEKEVFSRYTSAKSIQVIDYIFSRENVLEIIKEEVLQPKLKLYFGKRGLLNLPTKLVDILDSETNSFPIDTIDVSIDFYNQVMRIDFNSHSTSQVSIKKARLDGKKVKNTDIETKRMSLEISKQIPRLSIEDIKNRDKIYMLDIR